MTHTFIAYIDESGDDGLIGRFRQPGGRGGPSHWLSIGAVVWRASRDLDAVRWAQEIQAKLPAQKQKKTLHFSELDHQQRVMAINTLVGKPFRAVCVLANKPVIPDGIYTEKNQLYHYMCRYLIERISWLCRDNRRNAPEGDGRVKIVFARRGGMSYDEFRDYLQKLHDRNDPDIQIHWPVIDIDGIEAHDQPARYGLQIADLVVSGLSWGVEQDFYGNCECRFARALKPHVYQRGGNYLSYGAKLVPSIDCLNLPEAQREFVHLFERE